jgi:hypothetical protein
MSIIPKTEPEEVQPDSARSISSIEEEPESSEQKERVLDEGPRIHIALNQSVSI